VRRVRGRPEQKSAREDEAGLGMPDHLKYRIQIPRRLSTESLGAENSGEMRGRRAEIRGRSPDHLEGDCRRAADEAERGDVRPKGDEAGQHHQRQCARAAAPVAAAAVRGLLGEPDRCPALSWLLRAECGRQTCAEVWAGHVRPY